jgi:predicted nucleic acid-binding protein
VIVLDASVLIAHLDSRDAHHDRAFALLSDVAGEGLAASPVTLAEVLVGPARVGAVARADAALRRLGVIAVPIDADAPVRLATLRASTGLKLPDCCVVHAAEQVAAKVATFDDRLAGAARTRGIQVLEGAPAG